MRLFLTMRRHYYEDWLGRINLHPELPQSTEEAGSGEETPTRSACAGPTSTASSI